MNKILIFDVLKLHLTLIGTQSQSLAYPDQFSLTTWHFRITWEALYKQVRPDSSHRCLRTLREEQQHILQKFPNNFDIASPILNSP